jgi:peroxiredoxin
VLLLLGVSLALNVRLGWEVRGLRADARNAPGRSDLAIGVTVPPLTVKDLAKNDTVLDCTRAGKPTVLYVFTPACGWCRKNLPNIRALAASRGDRFAFVGVSLSDLGLRDYVEANKLAFEVYSSPARETIEAYRLGSTPQTIVVGSNGTVIRNWIGAYRGDVQEDVERFFNVKLPTDRE